jgi:hypothetical protein
MTPGEPTPDADPLFECLDCGARVDGHVDNRLCSACGGYLQNISVTRSQ